MNEDLSFFCGMVILCLHTVLVSTSLDVSVKLINFSFCLLDLLLLCVTRQMVSLFWQVDCQNLSVYIMSRNRFL